MSNKYKHIIWDLDHTLWDFNTNSKECISELLDDYKLLNAPIKSREAFLEDYMRINDECWAKYRVGSMDKATLRYIRFQKAFELHGVPKTESRKLSDAFCADYVKQCPKKTALIPGAIEVLEDLKSKRYNMSIMTNGFIEAQHVKMHFSGLNPYFDHTFISENLKAKKPHKKAYYAVLNALNSKTEDCIMIGDSEASDIQGAVNMGMDSIHFQPEGKRETKATFAVLELAEIKEIL